MKATGGALGAVLGYSLFSSQLSVAQFIEELLGSSAKAGKCPRRRQHRPGTQQKSKVAELLV